MDKKQLPIGISSFADIRQGSYYYVDKTPLIIDLLRNSRFVFLSRPRRFGKSLTIDTIARLFSGNKEWFRGLYAENNWDWDQTYPIIRLTFANEVETDNVAELRAFIKKIIKRNAKQLHVEFEEDDLEAGLGFAFQELVSKTYEKYQKPVVVLIDEYDKPILDNIHNQDIALEIRGILKSLYSQLKDLSDQIRFAMLTGVSKFGQMTIFSGLNHLEDITLQPQYSALCGYTQQELEETFASELEGVDLGQLRHWYNGYNWTGESVYNPFDILLFFKNHKDFAAYWIQSGSSSFLLNLIQEKQFNLTKITTLIANTDQLLSSTDIGSLDPLPVMFQTGYLTIDKIIQDPSLGKQFSFKFPNVEVRLALSSYLFAYYTQQIDTQNNYSALLSYLRQGDLEQMQDLVKSIFAGIPTDWYRKNNIAHYEGYWSSVFYTLFAGCCSQVRLEDATNQGHIDMTVIEQGHVYLFEFKMKHQGDSAVALQQIKDKGYADKYRAVAKRIYQIGVSFDEQSREIEFTVEQ